MRADVELVWMDSQETLSFPLACGPRASSRAALPHHAILIHMQNVELAVTIGEIHLDAPRHLRGTRPHLGDRVLEPTGQLDAGAMRLTTVRIDDGGTGSPARLPRRVPSRYSARNASIGST
jgi:hypothetical protein